MWTFGLSYDEELDIFFLTYLLPYGSFFDHTSFAPSSSHFSGSTFIFSATEAAHHLAYIHHRNFSTELPTAHDSALRSQQLKTVLTPCHDLPPSSDKTLQLHFILPLPASPRPHDSTEAVDYFRL